LAHTFHLRTDVWWRSRTWRYGGERVPIGAGRVPHIAAGFNHRTFLQKRCKVPRIERKGALDSFQFGLALTQLAQTGREIGPERGMSRISLSCTLEQLARPGGIPSLHHAQSKLVQDRRMSWCHLSSPSQQLISFGCTARGAGGF